MFQPDTESTHSSATKSSYETGGWCFGQQKSKLLQSSNHLRASSLNSLLIISNLEI
jgi:hypothetical protein